MINLLLTEYEIFPVSIWKRFILKFLECFTRTMNGYPMGRLHSLRSIGLLTISRLFNTSVGSKRRLNKLFSYQYQLTYFFSIKDHLIGLSSQLKLDVDKMDKAIDLSMDKMMDNLLKLSGINDFYRVCYENKSRFEFS